MNASQTGRLLVAFILALLVTELPHMQRAMAQSVPAVLRAQRIELVDAAGTLRARLNTEPDGEVVLRLMGQKGEIRVKLGASDTGSGLVLLDGRTQPGVQLLAAGGDTRIKLQSGEHQRLLEP